MTTQANRQDAGSYQGMTFRQYVEIAEAMDPAAAAGGAADSDDLCTRFPELVDVAVRKITIAGRHGDVAARIYRGPRTGDTAFVWVHGGAFIGGNLQFGEAHWVSLVIAAAGFPVLSLDYQKALRGVHYPVPSNDVLDGWLWATTHVDELGADLHLGVPAPAATSSPESPSGCATAPVPCRRRSYSSTRSSTANFRRFRPTSSGAPTRPNLVPACRRR